MAARRPAHRAARNPADVVDGVGAGRGHACAIEAPLQRLATPRRGASARLRLTRLVSARLGTAQCGGRHGTVRRHAHAAESRCSAPAWTTNATRGITQHSGSSANTSAAAAYSRSAVALCSGGAAGECNRPRVSALPTQSSRRCSRCRRPMRVRMWQRRAAACRQRGARPGKEIGGRRTPYLYRSSGKKPYLCRRGRGEPQSRRRCGRGELKSRRRCGQSRAGARAARVHKRARGCLRVHDVCRAHTRPRCESSWFPAHSAS